MIENMGKILILKGCNNRSVPNSQWSVAQKNHCLKLININIRAKKIQQKNRQKKWINSDIKIKN